MALAYREFDGGLLRRWWDTYANSYCNSNTNTYSQAGDAWKHFDSATSRDR